MKYIATLFSASLILVMSLSVYALDISFNNKNIHLRRMRKKESFEKLPLEIRNVFLNKIKNEKKLTTSEAFVEGMDVLSSKKYRSWKTKNKDFLPSVMDKFYQAHFENDTRKVKRKVTDAINILYSLG